jgi:hypothetical protein
VIPEIPPGTEADAARALFEGAGWRVVGEGDWATALADPGDEICARIVPFDPAYRIFAEEVLAGPPNRWLPRIDAILPLARDGYVVLMQRLWPADEALAHSFCDALGALDGRRDPPPPSGLFRDLDDPDLPRLAARVTAMLAIGASRYRLWGGSDIRAGQIMRTRDGDLKLVDPLFLAGYEVVAAIQAGNTEALADFTRSQLQDFLTIAAFRRGDGNPDPAGGLRAVLDRLDLTPRPAGSAPPAGPE